MVPGTYGNSHTGSVGAGRIAYHLRCVQWLVVISLLISTATGLASAMPIAVSHTTSPNPQRLYVSGEAQSAFAIQRLFTISEHADVDSLECIPLATVMAAGHTRVAGLEWIKDTSVWWPTWYLALTTEPSHELASQPVNVTPVAGHTYQVTFSFDLDAGIVAAELVDTANGKQLFAQSAQVRPYSGHWTIDSHRQTATAIYACEDVAYYDCFLPVNVGWQLETRQAGTNAFIPGFFMEWQDEFAIHTWSTGYTLNGGYRIFLENNGKVTELGQIESGEEHRLILAGSELPLGKSAVVVEYSQGSRVLFSDRQEISIGSAVVDYQPVKVNNEAKVVEGAVRILSRSSVANLPVKVEAELHKLTWDETKRAYSAQVMGRQVVFGGTVSVTAGKPTEIPFSMELPKEQGMWKVELVDKIGVDIDVARRETPRYFATYPSASVAPGQPFTVAILGDTQNYTEHYPGVLVRMTEWLAANARDKNIVAALQVGDITNHNVAKEWDNARTGMGVLQGIVPYVLAIGNHDLIAEGDWAPVSHQTTNISKYFPAECFPALRGTFAPGEVANSYHEFTFGGVDYLIMSLEWLPRDEVLIWANQVVEAYPAHKVIVVTHQYTYTQGGLSVIDRTGHIPDVLVRFLANESANDGQEVWNKFLRKHANISMVFSGHFVSTSIPWGIYTGDHGNTVYNFMVGNSDQPNGGDGWIALFEIYPDGKFQANYYSPYLGHSAQPSAMYLGGTIYHSELGDK